MKILLLTIVISLASLSLPAQIPFPSQSATWLYHEYDDFGNFVLSYQYYLDGDSIYQGETWSKLVGGFSGGGLVRQDTSLKVWIIPEDSVLPQLLYDFGAGIGDTIKGVDTRFSFTPDTLVVDTIYSPQAPYPGRVWRMRGIAQAAPDLEYDWIEGVGDRGDLTVFGPMNAVSGTSYLQCFTNDAFAAPGNPCTVSTSPPVPAPRIEIYPNPTAGQFRLRGIDPLAAGGLEIRNMQGQTVLKSDRTEPVIDLVGFPEGLYLLGVEINGQVHHSKLMLRK